MGSSSLVRSELACPPGQPRPWLSPPQLPGCSGAAVTTFSSLAPPDAAAREMFCSCLILSLKSDTHWITVMPAGTV